MKRFVAFTRRTVQRKPNHCVGCLHAHVQYATNARRAISCAYGGSVRPMKLDVLYCTDYQARNLSARSHVVGFVREIVPAD
jgi:hypothetical protein